MTWRRIAGVRPLTIIVAVPDRGAAFGGLEFGNHAAGAEGSAGVPSHGLDFRSDLFHHIEPFSVGMFFGIAAVKTVHIRKDDEKLGFDQGRDHGGEIVVVAEFDLLYGNRVVFIDNRGLPGIREGS